MGSEGIILLVPHTGQSTVHMAPVRIGSLMNSIFNVELQPGHTVRVATLRFKLSSPYVYTPANGPLENLKT